MGDACLGKSLSFPDIPRPPWPPGAWPVEPGSSPVCNVRGGWQEESDHEVSEPPWPSGSFFPITQDLTLFWSLSFLWPPTRCPVRVVNPQIWSGLMLGARAGVKFNFPFATFLWDCQTEMTLHVLWLKFGVLLRPLSFLPDTWGVTPCELVSSVLTQLIENSGEFWKHLIPNSLTENSRWEGVLNNLAQWVNRKSLFPGNTLLAQLKDESAWVSPEKTVLFPEGNPLGQGPWNSSHGVKHLDLQHRKCTGFGNSVPILMTGSDM